MKTAFLYGELNEEIYMEQPQGFVEKGKEGKVLQLHKAIYGLKQAACTWWIQLDKSLKEFGFHRIYIDSGVFIARHSDGTICSVLLAYINDIFLTGPNQTLVLF